MREFLDGLIQSQPVLLMMSAQATDRIIGCRRNLRQRAIFQVLFNRDPIQQVNHFGPIHETIITTMTRRLPYFRTPERIAALRQQLQQWAGTRWAHAGTRPNQMRCGVTGDCLFWVHAFKAIGALPPHITIPDYRRMEAAGDQMKMLRECIEATGVAAFVIAFWDEWLPPARLRTGDVLLFRNGMSGAHCGLVVQPSPAHFVHLSRNGFLEEPLAQDHWLRDLALIYRLVESESVVGVPSSAIEVSP